LPSSTVLNGCGGLNGFGVPPGIPDSLAGAPLFSLAPAATVDEGNNWINVSWGPLSLSNMSLTGGTYGNYGGGAALGNYAPATGSALVDFIACNNANAVGQGCQVTIPGTTPALVITLPTTDFFGNPRPDPGTSGSVKHVDAGAVETQVGGGGGGGAVASVSPTSLAFGNVPVGTTSAAQTLTLSNTGTADWTGISENFSAATRFSRPGGVAGGTCAGTLAAGATCTVNIVFSPNAVGLATSTVTINGNVPVTGSPVTLTGTGVAVGTLSFTSATNGTLATVLGVRTLTFTIPTPRAAVTSVVTVTNTSTAPLNIGAESFLVATTFFTITANTCANTTVAANGTCTVSVTYNTPTTSTGVHGAVLDFANNGSGTILGVTPLGLSGN